MQNGIVTEDFMRRLRICISLKVAAIMFAAAFANCNSEDTAVTSQISDIRSYLDGLGNSITYYSDGDVYYFVAANAYPPSVPAVAVEEGDEVSFYYEGYVFSRSATGGKGGIFATNRTDIIDALGLTPGGIEEGVKTITAGRGEVMNGIDRVISRSLRGDSIMIYMPSSEGYGGDYFNVVPPNSPLAFVITIEDVVK